MRSGYNYTSEGIVNEEEISPRSEKTQNLDLHNEPDIVFLIIFFYYNENSYFMKIIFVA